jgi:hypothetical protein
MTTLTSKAMLAQLSVHMWTARRYDAAASEEIADIHEATGDAGRFNKLLLPKAHLRGLQSAVTALRAHHATNTLPWTINGVGLLPATNYFAYMEQHRKLLAAFETAKADFLQGYDFARKAAQRDLGTLFQASDYPDQDALADRIGAELQVMPLPDAKDFRVALGDAEEARLRAEIEKSVEAAIDGAVRSLWQRVHDTVATMQTRLEAYKRDPATGKVSAPFRDSLVGNMRELVDLLGRLNVTNDSALEAMRRRLDEKLCQAEPEALREDDVLRASQARECKAVLDLMSGYVGTAPAMAAE